MQGRARPSLLNIDVSCNGMVAGLRSFKIQFQDHRPDSYSLRSTSGKSLTVPADTIWQAQSIFTSQLKAGDSDDGMVPDGPGQGNLHFIQKSFEEAFESDVLFSSDSVSEAMMTSTAVTERCRRWVVHV